MSLIFKSLKVGFRLEIQAFKREKLVLKAQMERVGKQLSRFRVQGTLLWFGHDDVTASYSNCIICSL